MSLYFVQHGLAVDKKVDPDRPLSKEGIRLTKNIADRLLNTDVELKKIVHSGKTRAQQTADIFSKTLNVPSVETIDYLNPMDDVKSIIPHLKDGAMYVGHLPHMEKLVSALLGSEDISLIQFENSAVACLQKTEQGYVLDWFLKPSVLS